MTDLVVWMLTINYIDRSGSWRYIQATIHLKEKRPRTILAWMLDLTEEWSMPYRPRSPSGKALVLRPGGTWFDTLEGAVRLYIAGEWLTKIYIVGRSRTRIHLKPPIFPNAVSSKWWHSSKNLPILNIAVFYTGYVLTDYWQYLAFHFNTRVRAYEGHVYVVVEEVRGIELSKDSREGKKNCIKCSCFW